MLGEIKQEEPRISYDNCTRKNKKRYCLVHKSITYITKYCKSNNVKKINMVMKKQRLLEKTIVPCKI